MALTRHEDALFKAALSKGWLTIQQWQQIEHWVTLRQAGQTVDLFQLVVPSFLSHQQVTALSQASQNHLGTTKLAPRQLEVQTPETSKLVHAGHIDDYLEVREELGRGGMGVVERVYDKRLNRELAQKRVLNPNGGKPEVVQRFRQRFEREALINAKLAHPAIAPIFEAGLNGNNQPFLLMKLIDGQSLKSEIQSFHNSTKNPNWRKGRIERRLLGCLLKIAEAVCYAHSKGILHRDLKPDNIMIGPFGETYLLDWGLAKDLNNIEWAELEPTGGERESCINPKEIGLTQEGTIFGTLGYMPPEQLDGFSEKGSDVFALACILTEILTGRSSIEGQTDLEKATKTAECKVVLPSHRVRVPSELDSIVSAALKPEINERPDSANFVVNLDAFLAENLVPLHHYSIQEKIKRWSSNNATKLLILLMAVSSLAVFAYFYLQSSFSQNQRELSLHEKNKLEEATEFLAEAQDLTHLQSRRDTVKTMLDTALGLVDNRFLLFSAAEIYADSAMYQEARKTLKTSIRRYPPGYRELFFLHRIDFLEDESKQVHWSQSLEEILTLSELRQETNNYVEFCRGVKHFRRREYKKALKHYQEAEKMGLNSAILYSNLGASQKELGNNEQALRHYNTAIEMRPGYGVSYHNRALVWIDKKDYKKAIADFSSCILLIPNDVDSFILRGFQCIKIENLDAAKNDFEVVLKLDPKNNRNLVGLAYILRVKGQFERSKELANQVGEFSDANLNFYLMIGETHKALGQYRKAIQAFQSYLDRCDSSPIDEHVRAEIEKCRELLNRKKPR